MASICLFSIEMPPDMTAEEIKSHKRREKVRRRVANWRAKKKLMSTGQNNSSAIAENNESGMNHFRNPYQGRIQGLAKEGGTVPARHKQKYIVNLHAQRCPTWPLSDIKLTFQDQVESSHQV